MKPYRLPVPSIIKVRMKPLARILGALLLAVFAQAQMKMTAEQLVNFIESSIRLKQNDRQVADYVRKIRLSDHLDERVVEDLQGKGAGQQTVSALKVLATASAGMPAPLPPAPKPVPVVIPPPDSIEQKAILAQITENAVNYSKGLPNFLCLQVTRRYIDNSGLENFRLLDTIAERLSYFDQKEDYKVVSVNNVPVTGSVKHEQLGGATSSGEFGSILHEIFAAESNTKFDWERWATLRGRRMYVYSFHVPQDTSKYTIYADSVKRQIVVGYRGLVYADRDTKMVMRIKMEVENIPVDFPVQSVELDMNYDNAKISGQEFLLPLKSEVRSREGKFLSRNEVEFRLYNRFSADTVIQFDDVPDALPADKTSEQPVK
jgi:hypothetical protein